MAAANFSLLLQFAQVAIHGRQAHCSWLSFQTAVQLLAAHFRFTSLQFLQQQETRIEEVLGRVATEETTRTEARLDGESLDALSRRVEELVAAGASQQAPPPAGALALAADSPGHAERVSACGASTRTVEAALDGPGKACGARSVRYTAFRVSMVETRLCDSQDPARGSGGHPGTCPERPHKTTALTTFFCSLFVMRDS